MPKQLSLFSIRDTERAKLRKLRDEIAQAIEAKKRRAQAEDLRWDTYRAHCTPLRTLR